MLSVNVAPRAAVWILGEGQEQLSSVLHRVPVDASVNTREGAALLRDETSPLAELWRRLDELPGVGWVTAGKLCARKRPALAPVYDAHVREAAGRPGKLVDRRR